MTAQSAASRVGSVASWLRVKVAAVYKGGVDLLLVVMLLAVVAFVAVPLGHHIYNYWHSFAAAWQPSPAQKAPTVKRVQS